MSAPAVTRTKKAARSAVPPPLPQVNLLPPSVLAARHVRAARRLLGMALVGVVVLGGVGFGFAELDKVNAQHDLTVAQDTAATLAHKAKAYAEVPRVKQESAQVSEARVDATTTEILWQPVLSSFGATLPSGTTIESLTVAASSGTSGTATQTDPLAIATVATLQFTARSQTVPDVAAWMDALSAVKGFADVQISQASLNQGQTGSTGSYYEVQGTVGLTDALEAHRFSKDGSK